MVQNKSEGLPHFREYADISKQKKVPESPPDETVEALLQLYNAGELARVVKEAQALTRQYPEAFIVWNLLGAAAAQMGILDQAVDAFEKVISIKPDYVDGYNNLGTALADQGELDRAIGLYKKIISIEPNYAEAFNNMGHAFHKKDMLEEAVCAYLKAIELQPSFAEAYNNIGNIYRKQGRLMMQFLHLQKR